MLLSFGLIALLSIGILLVVAGAAFAVWLATRRAGSDQGLWGLLSGAAVTAAFLAWTNRDGPGDVCHNVAGGSECGQQWNPLPFAIAAVVMLTAGLVLFVRMTPRRATRSLRRPRPDG